jgi:hypothetical protein
MLKWDGFPVIYIGVIYCRRVLKDWRHASHSGISYVCLCVCVCVCVCVRVLRCRLGLRNIMTSNLYTVKTGAELPVLYLFAARLDHGTVSVAFQLCR